MPPSTGPQTDSVFSAERHRRMERIETLLSKQFSGAQIVRAIAKQFDVSERQAYGDMAEVYARIHAETADDRLVALAKARRTWARRMRRCERLGKEADANYAFDRLCKLDGLYAPKKIEVSGSLSVSAQITSLVGVLDAEGLAALAIVKRQIALAREQGRLPAPPQPKAVIEVDPEPKADS